MRVTRRRMLPACALLVFAAFPVCASAVSPPPPAGAPAPQAPATAPPAAAGNAPDTVSPPAPDAPVEMRGLWVVRTSLVSPKSVHQVVATALKYHFNALFVQVRGRGDAWYNSPYEPRAEALVGQPPDFDPLQQVITEAHASGLQVHAWMNTYLTWSGPHAPNSPKHLWNAHRDWFACDLHGHCSPIPTATCEGAFLQPSNPAVQDHLFRVFTYVATHYDVDGIHFDYCRYAGSGYDCSASTLARFRDFLKIRIRPVTAARVDRRLATDRLAYVHAFPHTWADWRRAQVTALVTRISTAVKAAKPWVQVSAAVFPDADEAYAVRGQDWRGWLRSGALDAVALMAYGASTERILEETRRAVKAADGRYIYTGLGAWHLGAGDIARKIAAARQAGASGVNLFSYDGIHTRSGYLDTLARGVFASRAAPPGFRRATQPRGVRGKE
ncbi:MAG TPA: family 10 glycosylhydrolase [Chthonomonadaceae bacterium]|nr:family 10 glycosylhydrolase [Chthonomonadaceae bacterium]